MCSKGNFSRHFYFPPPPLPYLSLVLSLQSAQEQAKEQGLERKRRETREKEKRKEKIFFFFFFPFLSPNYIYTNQLGTSSFGGVCIVHAQYTHPNKTKERYLVDPASSHMLVLKIKPCMP